MCPGAGAVNTGRLLMQQPHRQRLQAQAHLSSTPRPLVTRVGCGAAAAAAHLSLTVGPIAQSLSRSLRLHPARGKQTGPGGAREASTERMPHRYALHPTLHCTTHPHHALLPHYESSSSPPTKRSSSTPHGHCRPLRAGRGVDDDDDAVVDGEESHCVSPLTRGCHPSVLIVHPPTPPNLVIAQAHLHPIIFQSSVHPPFSLLLPNHS